MRLTRTLAKPNPLYSKERVESLRAFVDVLVETAIKRRERVELVDRLLLTARHPETLKKLLAILDQVKKVYVEHQVDLNLMGAITETRLADESNTVVRIEPFVPEEDTYCRYTVAAAHPVTVSDSLTDLVVCGSPYASMARQYIGAPIIVRSWVVGVVCAYSGTPKDSWSNTERAQMAEWAAEASEVLELGLIGQH